jgi:GntR family transcriptional regulator
VLVAEGGLRSGDRLPGETELAVRFSVARPTIREAFKLLEQDGEVTVRHGLGRFVAPAAVRWPITRLESVTEMLLAMGAKVTNQVVAVSELGASAEEAVALDQPLGSRVVRLERVRLIDGRPVIYSVDVIPGWVIHEDFAAIDWTGSVRTLLDKCGASMVSSSAHIRAVTLPKSAPTSLKRGHLIPWLLMTQTHFAADGRRVLYSDDYHRGDTFTFNVLRRSAGVSETQAEVVR